MVIRKTLDRMENGKSIEPRLKNKYKMKRRKTKNNEEEEESHEINDYSKTKINQ